MLKIGITGGIGSGKTFITALFSKLKIPVYNSDSRAKELMATFLKKDIINLFGEKAYWGNRINKSFIANEIFSHPSLRKALNDIVHPAVENDFNEWCKMYSSTATYVLKESALLFETNIYKTLDKTILVTAPITLRIERLKKRDKLSENEIKKRIDSQWSDLEKQKLADYSIVNDEKILILPQIITIHKTLINQS